MDKQKDGVPKETQAMPSQLIGVQCEVMIPLVGNSDKGLHRDATWVWLESKFIELARRFSGPKIYKKDGVPKETQAMPSQLIGVQCEVMIPLVGNSDKGPHRDATWAWLESKFIELARGFSGPKIYKSLSSVSGAYMDPQGHLVRDENRHYIISLLSCRIDSLKTLLEEACLMFDQDFIYLNIGGQAEFVFSPNSPAVHGGNL